MVYRIVFEEICIECDTAREALALVHACWETEDKPATDDEPEEPTDIEEGDEPTELEPEPTREPAPEAAPQPKKQDTLSVPGAFERYRTAAVEYLRGKGKPQIRNQVATACGIPAGSQAPVFKDSRFTIVGDGLLWIAGEKFSAGASRPQFGESAINRARDTIAAELAVASGPMSVAKLAARLNFDAVLVEAALKSPRFKETDEEYELV